MWGMGRITHTGAREGKQCYCCLAHVASLARQHLVIRQGDVLGRSAWLRCATRPQPCYKSKWYAG